MSFLVITFLMRFSESTTGIKAFQTAANARGAKTDSTLDDKHP